MAKIIVLINTDGGCGITRPIEAARGSIVKQGRPIYGEKDGKRIIVGYEPGDVYNQDGVLIASGTGREETEDEFLQRVGEAACVILDEKGNIIGRREWRIDDDSIIPADRTFRNAWKPATGSIDVDMDKARDILKDKLRLVREPLLEKLDIEYQRADEKGDTAGKVAVADKKQELRDITEHPAIDAAKTPDDLKQVLSMEVLQT